jgi:hypothetical protein
LRLLFRFHAFGRIDESFQQWLALFPVCIGHRLKHQVAHGDWMALDSGNMGFPLFRQGTKHRLCSIEQLAQKRGFAATLETAQLTEKPVLIPADDNH